MKKLTLVILILLVAAGCNKQVSDPASPAVSDYKIYQDSSFGLQFDYPVRISNPQELFTVTDYSDIEQGTPGTFYQELAKKEWQERYTKAATYKVGDSCLDKGSADAIRGDSKCTVIKFSPLITEHYVDNVEAPQKGSRYYIISTSKFEVRLSDDKLTDIEHQKLIDSFIVN